MNGLWRAGWLALMLVACGRGPEGPADTPAADGADDADSGATAPRDVNAIDGDFDPTADDFGCLLQMSRVRRFRVANSRGHLDEALAVANSPDGGVYPVGTLVQLIPSEAMVKHAPGWNPTTHDWEFFALSVSATGTVIRSRGAENTRNAFGGNCFDCHRLAAPQWDSICESGHGCAPLPVTPEQIDQIQNADPRCRDR
jgi:hypothetical protein